MEFPGNLRKDSGQVTLQPPAEHLREHPLLTGKTSVGMISGENPRFPALVSGHEAMGHELNRLGLKYDNTVGKYGTPEKSFVVYGPTRQQMQELGKRFGQESVVYSQGGHPNHQLIYTNGEHEGKYHPATPTYNFTASPPEDNYTHLPGHGYLSLGFDFGKLHQLPGHAIESEHRLSAIKHEVGYQLYQTLKKAVELNLNDARSTMAADKEYTIPEMCQELAKALRERVNAYQEKLVELRKRELNKAGQQTTPHTEPGVHESTGNTHGEPGVHEAYSKAELAPAVNAGNVVSQEPVTYSKSDARLYKGAMCKSCGYEHLPGRHSLNKEEVKVKVKVKVHNKKSEDYIDIKHANDPKKRLKNVGQEGTTPDSAESKVVAADSDGDVKRGKALTKAAPGMGAPPPSGKNPTGPAPMPKAGSPKLPKAPMAKGTLAGTKIPPMLPGAKQLKLPGLTPPKESAKQLVHGLVSQAKTPKLPGKEYASATADAFQGGSKKAAVASSKEPG